MQLSKHPSRHSFTSGSPLQGQPCRGVRRCRTAPLLPITASVAAPTRLPDQQQAQQASEPAPSVRALNKLIGGLAFWQAQQKAKADVETDDNVMEDAVLRGREASGQHGLQPRPADIGQYLHPTGILETRYTRLMASLCSHTYYMEKLTQKMLWRKHRLNLVTTSRDIGTYEALLSRKSVKQAAAEGDGMAVSPRIAETIAATMDDVAPSSAALKTLNAALEAPPASSAAKSAPNGHRQSSPTEIVAQKLQAAAAAAAAAAAPLASGVSSFTGAFSGAVGAVPLGAVSSQLQSAALAGHSTAVATIATVTAAVNSTWRKDHPSKASKGKSQADPTQWFVCDDPMSFTRYFVLQGSETLDHWRVNLTFDPVPFEDPELGVKVHRGVYEAAEILYQRFLPLVVEHLASRPFAKIAFTGHSLGGSLGTLLQLMFLRRGEIPAVAISPTYTFGAPAVFCEGGACKVAASAEAQSAAEAPASQEDASTGSSGPAAQAQDVPAAACGLSNPGHSLLHRLGLPEGAFRNIVMDRDIVPRAFACDYTLVADLLRRVGGGFKEHPCLSGPDRVVMYFFVGKMLVLQPDMEHNFVRPGEEYHPMLPTGPGLYTLRTPTALDAMAANAKKEVNNIVAAGASRVISASRAAQAARKEAEQLAANLHAIPSGELAQSLPQLSRSLERVSIAVDAAVAPRTKLKAQAKLGKPSPTLRDAVMDLMNYPHPLTTLGDVSAYGNDGAISRYHDPDHYTQALGGVLRHKTRPWRALMRQDEPDSTEQGARWYVGLQQQQRGMAQRAARRGMTQQQYQARMLQRVNSCGSYMVVEQRPASVLSMSSEWESLRQQGA